MLRRRSCFRRQKASRRLRNLRPQGKATGHVYFFDTNARDLLSQGVIVRLRQGVDNDLTVKLRPPEGRGLSRSKSRS